MPQATATVYNDGYIGSETFLLKRDIYKNIFDRYRENEGLTDFLLNLGYKSKTANTTFHWWEHDYLINYVTIASVAGAAGAGNPADVTIEASAHQESGSKSPFKVKDTVMVGGLRGWVSAVDKSVDDAHVYTIVPLDATVDLVTDLTALGAGTPITSYGNAHADGTFHPDSMARKPIKYDNVTQIVKDKYEAHGSESANESEVFVNGKRYYYIQGQVDSLKRQMLNVENTMVFGEKNTNAANVIDNNAPDGPGAVNTTEGLEKSIENRGIVLNYAAGTDLTYDDLEEMVRLLDVERAEKTYCGMLGTETHLDFEAAMHGRTQNTAIDFSMFGKGNAKQKAVDFDFKGYTLGGYTMQMKKWETLNYLPVSGVTGSTYPNKGFMIPMGYTRDAKDSKGMHTISIMYKENDRDSRWMTEFTRGQAVTGKDSYEFNHQCDFGLRLAKVNAMIKLEE